MLSPNEYVSKALCALDQYVTGITANTIVNNQYERLAVERFIKFKNQYQFKETELKKVLKFFSLIQIPIRNDVIQYPIAQHEVFWLANIYALWRNDDTRLFDQSFISISKGNNKSTFSSICSLYSVLTSGLNSHIICVASTKDQARQLIEIMTKIIKNSVALADMFKVNRNIIINKSAAGNNRIEIKSSDVGGIHGIGAGLVLTICDEYAQFDTSELQTVLKSAQEAKTKNHHQLIITHSTSNKFKSPAYDLQQTCQQILKGEVDADNIFTQIFTLDSVDEFDKPEMWRKSNPMLGLSVDKQNLITAFETAKIFADKMQTFKTYNLNLWIDDELQGENWIADDVITENMQEFEFDKDLTLTCGVDLSHQRDLSCIGWLQYNAADDKFYCDVQFIFPNNERKKIKEHGSIDLSRWFVTPASPNNYIIKSTTPFLDQEQVLDVVKNLNDNVAPIDAIGFDPFLSGRIEYEIQSRLGLDIVNVPMNWKLTPAIQFAERLLLSGRLIMKKNPVLRWNFQNTIVTQTDQGNLYLKKRNRESIDGVVAIVIALSVWMERNQSRYQFLLDGFDKLYTKSKAA